MATYFALVGALMTCTVYVNAFSCAASDPAVCKNKFSETFSADFKILHLNAMRKLFTTYLDFVKVISNELPENDALKPDLVAAIAKVSKDLQNLNANTNDIEKVSEIISQTLDDTGLHGLKSGATSKHFFQLAEKYHFKETLTEVVVTMYIDTAKLWADIYKALRAEDKKTYPAYESVNNLMNQIREDDGKNPRHCKGLYIMAAEMLGHDFNMEYPEAVAHII